MKNILIKFERNEGIDYHIVAYKGFSEDSWDNLMNNLDQYNNTKGIVWYDYKTSFVKYGNDAYKYILDALTEEQKEILQPGNLIEVRTWDEKYIFTSGHTTINKFGIYRLGE